MLLKWKYFIRITWFEVLYDNWVHKNTSSFAKDFIYNMHENLTSRSLLANDEL